MALVGYARTSTVGQPLEVQRDKLKASGVDRIYEEQVSGVKQDRPELKAMLDYVREGDTVVVCKFDRIARSTKHLLEIVEGLEAKGVAFKALNIDLDTSTPTGKLMLTMLGAVATFEREMMLERQAEGIAQAKANGVYKGRKATAMAKATQVFEYLDQGLSKASIARELEIGTSSVFRIIAAGRP